MNPIVLRWTPEPADLQESVATGRWGRGGAARHKTAIVATVLLVAAVICGLAGQPWLAVVPLAGLLPGLVQKPLNRRAIWKAVPSARQPTKVVVLPDAMVGTAGDASTRWRWSAFGSAVETERMFVLMPVGKRGMVLSYLPKRALPPAEVDRLRWVLGQVLPGGVTLRRA